MDAHFFRRLCDELADILTGARVEKIYRPAPEVTNFVLYAAGRKHNLLLRAGRRFPLLFLSDARPENPFQPDAKTMWLRKYLVKRRLGRPRIDWVRRCIAFPVCRSHEQEGWLLLDLREGASIVSELSAQFGAEPDWPEPHEYTRILATREAWATFPQFSPPLRTTLAALEPLDAQALLVDLEAFSPGSANALPVDSADGCTVDREHSALSPERPDVFLYTENGTAKQAFVWPLPSALLEDMSEVVFSSAVDAAGVLGNALLFSEIARAEAAEQIAPAKAAIKKTTRTLDKLEREHERLQSMVDGQVAAQALQADLWRIGGEQKCAEITVTVPRSDGVHEEQRIVLDPKLTVRENMARMFKQATRGKRGLKMLTVRKEALEQELLRLQGGTGTVPSVFSKNTRFGTAQQKRATGRDKTFHRFRSSDGFVMLRGRSAEGNHTVLTRASAHDIWFHAEDGASAHLVIHLDYPDQVVPERTMYEAAILTGLKSWERDAGRARIMCALVKEVRKIKGGAPGKVRVAKQLQALTVELDEALEEQLRSGA